MKESSQSHVRETTAQLSEKETWKGGNLVLNSMLAPRYVGVCFQHLMQLPRWWNW